MIDHENNKLQQETSFFFDFYEAIIESPWSSKPYSTQLEVHIRGTHLIRGKFPY